MYVTDTTLAIMTLSFNDHIHLSEVSLADEINTVTYCQQSPDGDSSKRMAFSYCVFGATELSIPLCTVQFEVFQFNLVS